MVATALVPVFDAPPNEDSTERDAPKAVGDDPKAAPQPIETVDACWGEGMDEKEYPLTPGEETVDVGEETAPKDGAETDYEPSIAGEDEKDEWDRKNLEKAVGEMSQSLKVRHVTLMEPVESRNVKHVVPAMDLLVTRMRYMGVCVTRIHSDRAKELLSTKFQVMG